MAFKPAVKQVSAAKIGGFGPMGSGKTTLMAMLAIYLSKTYHNSAPVAFQDTEKGADFVQPYFDLEGVPLLTEKTRAFVDLKNAGKRAKDGGACVLIDDSLTHFWVELLKTVKGDATRLDIKKIGEAKERWAEFTSNYDRENVHWLVAGRLGYDWENVDVEDEDGKIKNELLRGGTKMKAEGDFSYEPDLVLELSSADDPDAVDYKRLKRGRRLVKMASGQIHVAVVKKCRVRELNGQIFSWPDKEKYKPGDYKKIAECFLPYFNFLNIGGEHVAFDNSRNSREIIDTSNKKDWYQLKVRREIAAEEIKGALGCVWGAATGKDAQAKSELLFALFNTHSWTAVEALHPDILEHAASICIRMKQLAQEKMPTDRPELLALAEKATADINNASGNELGDTADDLISETMTVSSDVINEVAEQFEEVVSTPAETSQTTETTSKASPGKPRRTKREAVAQSGGTPEATPEVAGSNPAPSRPTSTKFERADGGGSVPVEQIRASEEAYLRGKELDRLPNKDELLAFGDEVKAFKIPPETAKEIILKTADAPRIGEMTVAQWTSVLAVLKQEHAKEGGILGWWKSTKDTKQAL